MKRGQRGFGPRSEKSFALSSAAPGSSLSYLAELPSFAGISDPNLIVSLKNVLKKDSTTKAKGLEDLVMHAQSHPFEQAGGVEESVLTIWTQIYARISIDNSRRVRELSHLLQLALLRSARKRMERYMPTVVGPWLAGLYDRDRVVARAANEGLSSFLTTSEKLTAFWHKCQPQILDYAIEAIRERENTLSDERSTTAEDAQAKYFRVVMFSLSLVLGLLQRIDDGGLKRMTQKYDEFFAEEAVWTSITLEDPTTRKTACLLLSACLGRHLPYGATNKARQAFVTGGLKTNQAGSAFEFVKALAGLTALDPSFWISASGDKKSPIMRLQAFISKGSQGSPPKFWEALGQLLAIMPDQSLGPGTASRLLSSIKAGITNREEPRTNTSYSWRCFIDVAKRFMTQLPDEAKPDLAREQLLPLLHQFLFTATETAAIPTGPVAMSILADAHIMMVHSSSEVIQVSSIEWQRLGTILCANISSSLPEVSKDYESSQNVIAEQGRRWFGLVGHVYDILTETTETQPAILQQITEPSNSVLSQCYALLQSRNLKPFGAARIIEYALSTSRNLLSRDFQPLISFLHEIVQDDFGKLAESRSAPYLISCLAIIGSDEDKQSDYQSLWQSWLVAALSLPSGRTQLEVLTGLLSQDRAIELAKTNDALQEKLYEQAQATLDSERDAWDTLEASLVHHTIRDDIVQKLALDSVSRLSTTCQSVSLSYPSVRMIRMIAQKEPNVFAQGPLHMELVSYLLALSELDDSFDSLDLSDIRSILDNQTQGNVPAIDLIRTNLEGASIQSLGIQTLRSQAEAAVESGVASWKDVLPNTDIWMKHLDPFLRTSPDPALSITNSIGGAVALTNSAENDTTAVLTPRDRDGRSVPARMALYTGALISHDLSKLNLPRSLQCKILYLQCLAVCLASDQMTLSSQGGLWQTLENTSAFLEAEDMIATLRGALNHLVQSATEGERETEGNQSSTSIIRGLVDLAIEDSKETSPRSVYSARILSELLQVLVEAHGMPNWVEKHVLKLEYLRVSPETSLLAAGIVTGLGDAARLSKAISNFCNRLVSDLAVVQADAADAALILLTLTAQVYETGELPVANNRVVFAVKQITSWLEQAATLRASTCAAICSSLAVLLPCMKDVYGLYWENALKFCESLWDRALRSDLHDTLPFVHASLKLVKKLESIIDANDDLEDALRDHVPVKSQCLIELLRIGRPKRSQPLDIFDGILCREVEKLPISKIPASEELFSLVASESREISSTAFVLLSRKLPAEQAQKSVDVLLDKTDARLPDELLSLFLEPPLLEQIPDEALLAFPSSLRSYLLSWKLLFEAYSASQFKVRDDYTEQLKGENLTGPLFDFMFDVLGHSAAHPLNLDRENLGVDRICEFDVRLAEAETGEYNLHWLLAHLYYLALRFIPGLFRSWYMSCRSKQTKLAVESWTAKYFSPIISSEVLDSVESWAREQSPSTDDDQELVVKVSKPAREVTAGYQIDEAQAAIVIKIPPSYPIDNITVSSLNRVAVTERKWQSWILTTQGAITLYNGNIIDGLQVFKRNIFAALAGQSECAICYSIISTDKSMPDKRCATCSHLFHKTCLYKWFQTSNQNTCPLCRNPIEYLGADTAKRRQGRGA